uniref:ACB domain-containing protein n=1 Tax=Aplanochytrium stocchinoi TaxID=215587 RepID=A0A7S3LL64_9STRA
MSLEIQKKFARAVKYVKNAKTVYSLEDKLIIYAYTKQSITGDCDRPKPNPRDKLSLAKWKAWTKLKGLSKTDAMKKYLENLKKMDPNYKDPDHDIDMEAEPRLKKNQRSPDQIRLELQKTDEEFQELPPLKNESATVDPRHVSYIGGINPVTQLNDDIARSDLLSRLTAFYIKHDKSTLNEGIGNIVDIALEDGEESLNQKLMNKYGEDLDSFEDEKNITNSIKLLKREKIVQSTLSRAVGKERNPLDEKFMLFFQKNDPGRIDTGFEVLHEYINARGSIALNKKLFQKYGEDLDTMFGGKSAQHFKMKMRDESATTSHFSSKNKISTTRNMMQDIPQSPGSFYALADDSHEMLTQYYQKYEPRRVLEHGVDGIYKWGQRNGLEALNRQLKTFW